MTSKEKAQSLIDSFLVAQFGVGNMKANRLLAIECSIITIDELLKLYDRDYQDKKDKTYWHPYDYFTYVKTELESMKGGGNG